MSARDLRLLSVAYWPNEANLCRPKALGRDFTGNLAQARNEVRERTHLAWRLAPRDGAP